ncbi:YycH family regulatory protein [Halalkalibacillus halophilus]|uniref:YycH family regulatory protein n=1 Tax=Halalkalibacillus halophilus TaxID=392827 RepID=UPI000481C3CD|nr:two-component system activity regulator YycH [Halalkalibacillus halophilus]
MNIEHLKTIILVLLVGASLLLTLALWTYQPDFEELDQATYLDETELGGEERNVRELIRPTQISFNNFREYSMIKDQETKQQLYDEITDWSFSQIDSHTTGGNASVLSRNMEVTFPIEVPLQMIGQIFDVEDFEYEWNQTFNRVYFQLVQSSENMIRVQFASNEHEETLQGEIESGSAYELISDYIVGNNTIPAERIDLQSGTYIYVPTEPVEVSSPTILTERLERQTIINILFNNPSLVRQQRLSSSTEDRNFTDGTRELQTSQVLRNQEFMTYVNPLTVETMSMTDQELIRRSIDFNNDHLGFTDDFQIDQIQNASNTIDYRMHYDGTPIFDESDYWMMEQSWSPNELQEFNRPLFETQTRFQNEGDVDELDSGIDVYQFFENNQDEFSLDLIENMRIGYAVEIGDEVSGVLFLQPTWHIYYAGRWRTIDYFEERVMLQEESG